MRKGNFRILSNERYKGNYYNLSIASEYIAKKAIPGQFVHIKCSTTNEPLLRRPFSIHSVSKDRKKVTILYELLGPGTRALSKKKKQDLLDVIGPLGSGFDWQPPTNNKQPPVLIAGGIGTAPLLFLGERLIRGNNSGVTIIIGARTKDQVLCKEEFKKLGCCVKIATEDGSLGFRGRATDLLKKTISSKSLKPSAIYGCGPHGMLKEVSKITKRHKIDYQASLEEVIACGLGACLGCAVETKTGYKLVCKDGPVFDGNEIVWE